MNERLKLLIDGRVFDYKHASAQTFRDRAFNELMVIADALEAAGRDRDAKKVTKILRELGDE